MANSVICRFNYTNRIKINQNDVAIRSFHPVGNKPAARLDKLVLPESGSEIHGEAAWLTATVIFEAWRLRTNSHFKGEIGTVAELAKRNPPIFEARLEDFEDPNGIAYRVKVVSADKKLLAQADRLSSLDDMSGRGELIQVYPEDIGQEVWRIDWSDSDSGPKVLINKNLPDPAGFLTNDPLISAVILPSIVREVLYGIAHNQSEYSEQDWYAQWLGFIVLYADRPLSPDMENDEINEWVTTAVSAFSAAHKFCGGIVDLLFEAKKEE